MNPLIMLLLFFALLGAIDKIFANRFKLGEEFDRGLSMMGSLALSMSGIYCFAVLGGQLLTPWISQHLNTLPFDPSLLAGALLAPDMGGFSIASQIARTSVESAYSGILLSSTLGSIISFSLPVALGGISAKSQPVFMNGVVFGIITIPAALFVGGLLLQMHLITLLANLWPVALLCVVLALLLLRAPKAVMKALTLLGSCIRILSIALFCVLAVQLFLGSETPIPSSLIEESLTIICKVSIIICGSFVLSKIVLRFFEQGIRWLAGLLDVNQYSVIGLLLSLVTCVSTFAIYEQMDERGQCLNAAFCVSSAFVFGGQLAFVSSVQPGQVVLAYIVSKLTGGVCAVIAAGLYSRQSTSQQCSIYDTSENTHI